ncbi:MAG: hypothetical protein WC679_01740 [Bacteroidales bacterium]|jgi:hypothetical protein
MDQLKVEDVIVIRSEQQFIDYFGQYSINQYNVFNDLPIYMKLPSYTLTIIEEK